MSYNANEINGEEERLRIQAALPGEIDRLGWVGLPEGSVLDVGCGPGHFAKNVMDHFYGVKVMGLDKDPFPKSPIYQLVQHATDLSFSDGTFDGAYARLALRHMENPAAVLAEMVRVVRPGGFVGAIDSVDSSLNISDWPSHWTDVLQHRKTWFWRRSSDPDIGRRLPELLLNRGVNNVKTAVLKVTTEMLGAEKFYDAVIKPFVDAAQETAPTEDFKDWWVARGGRGSIQLWIAGGIKP